MFSRNPPHTFVVPVSWRFVSIAAGFAVSLFNSACKPTKDDAPARVKERWKIVQVSYGARIVDRPETHADNAILLDTESGQTWLLWPTKDRPARYSWIALSQRTDSPVTPPPDLLGPTASASP